MARVKTVESSLTTRENKLKTAGKTIPSSTNLLRASKKFKPGTVALREIRKYQKSSSLLVKARPFQRIVRSIVHSMGELKFASASIPVLQEATENFLVGMLEDSYRCAIHAKRVTLLPRDIILIYKIKYSSVINTKMFSAQ